MMASYLRVSVFTCCMAVLTSFPASAHHAATATFDLSQSLEIEGVVTKFAFNNPHVAIYLMVTDEQGNEQEWMATAPAVAPFRSNWGWTEDTVQEGQYLKLIGRKARHNGPMILMERDDIEGGALVELNPEDGSLIRVLGGADAESGPNADLAIPELFLSDGRPNLSGTWNSSGGGPPPRPAAGSAPAPTPGPPAGGDRNSPPLNTAGRTLQETWDPAQDPAFVDCAPRSVHRVLLDRHTLRLTQEDDYVIVELEGDGSRRLIYLNAPTEVTTEHSPLGRAVAYYEGDTLVIETDRMSGGASSQAGNILSDQMTMVERYRRVDSDQGAGLELSIWLNDPIYLSTPWQLIQSRSLTGEYRFAETECQLPLYSN
jgi:hypothetical protein